LEAWALRAIERWPNVPALFGWLGLDRRGRWLIQGEVISRPQIIDTINRNYEADAYGRWFFQNGPQRGYMTLETAPFIAHVSGDKLITHTQLEVREPAAAYLDEEGSLLIASEHGPAALIDSDLHWALSRMVRGGASASDEDVLSVLALPSGSIGELSIRIQGVELPVRRLDRAVAPQTLGFVREPLPRESEAFSNRMTD
jgi:hypothetical protein